MNPLIKSENKNNEKSSTNGNGTQRSKPSSTEGEQPLICETPTANTQKAIIDQEYWNELFGSSSDISNFEGFSEDSN